MTSSYKFIPNIDDTRIYEVALLSRDLDSDLISYLIRLHGPESTIHQFAAQHKNISAAALSR